MIRWFDDDIMFPEIMPNGCGMIVVRLDELTFLVGKMENALEKRHKELEIIEFLEMRKVA